MYVDFKKYKRLVDITRRSRLTNIENKLVVTRRERAGEAILEGSGRDS